MKKIFLLSLFSSILIFSVYIFINNIDAAEVILNEGAGEVSTGPQISDPTICDMSFDGKKASDWCTGWAEECDNDQYDFCVGNTHYHFGCGGTSLFYPGCDCGEGTAPVPFKEECLYGCDGSTCRLCKKTDESCDSINKCCGSLICSGGKCIVENCDKNKGSGAMCNTTDSICCSPLVCSPSVSTPGQCYLPSSVDNGKDCFYLGQCKGGGQCTGGKCQGGTPGGGTTPGGDNSGTGAGTGGIDNPLKWDSFGELVNNLIDIAFGLAIIIVPLVVLFAAFLYFTSAGDPAKVKQATQSIMWAVIGFAIVLFAKAIISVLQHTILGVK